MQRIVQAVRSCQEVVKAAILEKSHGRETTKMEKIFSRLGWMSSSSPSVREKGLENVTVADILMGKGEAEESTGSWLWCHSNDIVSDAVKNVIVNTKML